MKKEVNIGVIGIGGIGKIHTWTLMNTKDCRVVAACSRHKDKLQRFKQGIWEKNLYTEENITPKYEIERIYTDYRDLVRDKDVDAVFVCVPNALHFDISLDALKNGKHCFVEKPMCSSTDQAKKLVSIAEKNNLILQVGHVWRFHKDVRIAKTLIFKGAIGDVVKVKAYSNHVLWGPKGWFVDPKLSGGGSLVDMGVHAIDTVRFLLNDVRYASVYADIKTRYGDYDVDDTNILFLRTENDIPVIVESGWNQTHSDGEEASVQIFGTKGYIRIFPTQAKIYVDNFYGSFIPEQTEPHNTLNTFIRQARNFVSAIKGEEKVLCSGKDGEHIIEVCEAAYRSANTDTVVRIPS